MNKKLKTQPVRVKVIDISKLVALKAQGLSLREISRLEGIHFSKIKRLLDAEKKEHDLV